MGPDIPIHDAEDEVEWPEDERSPRRRRAGWWIVATVMVAAFGFLSFVVERRYRVVELGLGRIPRQAAVDPRLESFVLGGERALANGELDVAQGDFDKASVLAERDPRVLVDEARVAEAKADIPWLRGRLLPADATLEARVTRSQMEESAAIARRASDEAMSIAPQDPRAILSKLDALRLSGDVDGARGYVVAVFARASEPETAYSLAALDLAQPGQPLGAAIERLRLAAAGELRPGRAEAALVYALVKAGDVPGARVELSKLDAAERAYPLLSDLHAWIGADRTAVGRPAESSPPAPSSSASSTPTVAMAATPPAGGDPARTTPASGSDPLQAAMDAVRKGDFDRAERIYQAILTSHPGDSQALAGLGDVLRMRHDLGGAIDAYTRAIKSNPSYVPAVVGLADTQWAQGNHADAARTYKSLVDHFPDGTYPAYVNQRAGE